MAESTDKGVSTNGNGHDKTSEPRKPQDFLTDFSTLFRLKKQPERNAIVYVDPVEIGVDADEAGMVRGDRFGFEIQPLKGGETAEIRELIKDFEEPQYTDEYFREICRRGLVKPAIPDTAEGRKVMDRWLPGTRQVIAQAVLNLTGMGLHDVKSAKGELGKLVAMTPSTSSS